MYFVYEWSEAKKTVANEQEKEEAATTVAKQKQ